VAAKVVGCEEGELEKEALSVARLRVALGEGLCEWDPLGEWVAEAEKVPLGDPLSVPPK